MGRNILLGLGLVLAVLGVEGCRSGDRKVVYFGPTPVYQLSPDTRMLEPDAALTPIYQCRFNFHPSYNQPLHRLVRGRSGETVYLGLVLPPLPPDLGVLVETDSVWQLRQRRQVSAGWLGLLANTRRGEYNVRYVGKSTKSRQTHVINLLTTDSTMAYDYFQDPKLFKGKLLL